MSATNDEASRNATVPPALTGRKHAAWSANRRTVFCTFFFIGAIMAAVIAGLLAAMLHSSGMEIAQTVAITFVTTLGLAMTTYHFLDSRTE
jgi:uncharacterized protein YacL